MHPKAPQPAQDLLANVHFLPSTESEPQEKPSNEQPRLSQKALNKLWLKMTEIFGHRWTSSFGESANQDHSWAKILAGLNGTQIANGLGVVAADQTLEWPPSANVFRGMCLQVPGMPSTADAWIEALQGKYTHDGVRVAAEATGTFDLRQAKQTDKPLFQRFERNYAIVIRRAQTGQSLEGRIATGIGHDSKTPYQAQLAHSHQEARDLITAQGLPTDPKVCRALLLAKFKIRRDTHA